MQKINSKDISVIVQGAIDNEETPKCLKSIRECLPDCEIILSTWQNSDTNGLDFDILVLSEDPGSVTVEESKHQMFCNNINRQLISTQEGLKNAARTYALKLRSDLILTNADFLEYFDKFQSKSKNYNLFKRKILVSDLFTRFNMKTNDRKRVKMPFHISDWWQFGLREDLETYFLDTKPVEEPYFTNYFNLEENKHKDTPYRTHKFKFSPEQYFAYSCFNRNFEDIYMEDASDYSDELMEKFRECIVNNFVVLEFKHSGICLNKYPYCKYSKNERFLGDPYIGLYNFYRYENEYKKYCDKNYTITASDSFFKNDKIAYNLLGIYKHIANLVDTKMPPAARLEQLFIGIPLSVIRFVICVLKEKLK